MDSDKLEEYKKHIEEDVTNRILGKLEGRSDPDSLNNDPNIQKEIDRYEKEFQATSSSRRERRLKARVVVRLHCLWEHCWKVFINPEIGHKEKIQAADLLRKIADDERSFLFNIGEIQKSSEKKEETQDESAITMGGLEISEMSSEQIIKYILQTTQNVITQYADSVRDEDLKNNLKEFSSTISENFMSEGEENIELGN